MIKSPLENVNGELYLDSVSTLKLAEEYGTPLYVMSERKIRENYRRFKSAFSKKYNKTRVFYSAKANTNLSILRILKSEGAGIDAVSQGEVFLAFEAGLLSDNILHTGNCADEDELQYLLEKQVVINVDSLSQLERLLKMGTPTVLSVRINPNLGAGHHQHVITAGKTSKFGVHKEAALKAYKLVKNAGVKSFGMHMHIGSGIMDASSITSAMKRLLDLAKNVHEDVGIYFDFINFGGGIGVPYMPEEKEVDLELFSDKLVGLFKEKSEEYSLGEPEFWLEPGRYLVVDTGILLTRVNMIKHTPPFRIFAGVDAGFNTLIRPAMYGSYHHILVANKLDQPSAEEYDVVGPLCESGDTFASGRLLPKLSEGDLLAILNAGAYGFSMASQYNSRPRPAEVLVKEGHYELIRERETLQGLLRGQRIASWLKD
jgi:diaminopimelate decarboxylase